MHDMDAIRQTFFEECDEQLSELEGGLLQIQTDGSDQETINAVFRAVHSIKGGAGAFKPDDLVQFAHTFETTLDLVRSEKLAADETVLSALLRAADVLADLVSAASAGTQVDPDNWRPVAQELSQFVQTAEDSNDGDGIDDTDDDIDFQPVGIAFDDLLAVDDNDETDQNYEIYFAPRAELYAYANDPILLIREVAQLGAAEVVCDTSDIPLLGDFEPDGTYVSWKIDLKTTEPVSAILEIFEFVEDDCDLRVEETTREEKGPELNVPADAIDADGLDDLGGNPEVLETASSDLPAPTIEAPTEHAKDGDNSAAPQRAAGAAKVEKSPRQQTIRADVERIDHLVNLVGELVINQSMLAQSIAREGLETSSDISVGLDELDQLIRAIQDGVMAIRAQPVQPMFQRMSRVVREALAATGKSARLETEGEMTEVDKTILEKLSDPLTHMIRNAIDHGLEDADTRTEQGKSSEGRITLSAAHKSGRVVLEVSDDGAGINRARVFEIAVEKGLISADADLSDNEIDNLIFAPGFSTASSVSDLSGRGVGMDVVRQSIQALGGRVSIASQPGHGSTFSLSLPLTLAVLDGMVVSVGAQTLIIPITSIVETLRPTLANVHQLGSQSRLVSVRDELVPLIEVGDILGFSSNQNDADPDTGVVVLVETEDGSTSALKVDTIEDQTQVVIKSLEQNYGQIPGVAAATILGTGQVALIADIEGLVDCAKRSSQTVATPMALAG